MSDDDIQKDLERYTGILRKHNCLKKDGTAKHYKTILTLPLSAEQYEEVTAAKKERAVLLDKLASRKSHKRKCVSVATPDAKLSAVEPRSPYPALHPPRPILLPARHELPPVQSLTTSAAVLSVRYVPPQEPRVSLIPSASSSSDPPASSLSVLASAASSALPAATRCKWCNTEACSTCARMQGRFTDSVFLQLVCAIAAHARNPRVVALSHFTPTPVNYWTVAHAAERQHARFAYSTEDHEELIKAPCDYCGAAAGGLPVCAEPGSYTLLNMLSLCAFCVRIKSGLPDSAVRAKCKEIEAFHRKCACDAPRFMDTGMCARAYLTKTCGDSK